MGDLFSICQHLWWNNSFGVHENMTEKDNSKGFVITGVEDEDKICKDLWYAIQYGVCKI